MVLFKLYDFTSKYLLLLQTLTIIKKPKGKAFNNLQPTDFKPRGHPFINKNTYIYIYIYVFIINVRREFHKYTFIFTTSLFKSQDLSMSMHVYKKKQKLYVLWLIGHLIIKNLIANFIYYYIYYISIQQLFKNKL